MTTATQQKTRQRGFAKILKTTLISLGKSNPAKSYSANDILTEILRHNPGTPTSLVETYRVEISRRLSVFASNNKIQRVKINGKRYAYLPATLDLSRTTRKTKPAVTVLLPTAQVAVANTTSAVSSPMQQIRQLLSQLTPLQLSEVVSVAASSLATQAEENANSIKTKLSQLMQTL